MVRKRKQLGVTDDGYRNLAVVEAAEANLRLQRFKKTRSCGEQVEQLRAAAEALAEANAYQLSIQSKNADDRKRGERLRELDQAYQRSWERLRRRCRR